MQDLAASSFPPFHPGPSWQRGWNRTCWGGRRLGLHQGPEKQEPHTLLMTV